MLVPGLRPVFQTFAMNEQEWTVLLVLSVSIIPAVEIMKLVQRLLGKNAAVEAVLGPISTQRRGAG